MSDVFIAYIEYKRFCARHATEPAAYDYWIARYHAKWYEPFLQPGYWNQDM